MQGQRTNSRKTAGRGGAQMPMRRRRKKYKAPKGQPSDADLIKSYLEAQGQVTKCPPGYAMGSLVSTCHGLDG